MSPIRSLVKEFLQAITHFNLKIIKLVVQGIPVFITEKTMAKMLNLPKTGITKLPTNLTKEKDKERKKEKEATIYYKIVSPKALVSWEGWKVSFFKGMYATRLPTLLHVIWWKGSQLTYVGRKLFSFVILVEQRIKVNYVALVFNNLYTRFV